MSPPNGIPAHLVQNNQSSRSNSPIRHPSLPEQIQELPPPPPIPKQLSPPKQSTPVQAPPPPPPPPMPLISNGPMSGPPPLINGDLAKIMSASPPKLTPVKDRQLPKQAPPMDDPRNDLLKAIRDGIKLRKVSNGIKAKILCFNRIWAIIFFNLCDIQIRAAANVNNNEVLG